MDGDFVIILYPSLDLPKSCFGIRQICYSDITHSSVLIKAYNMLFDRGAFAGIKQGLGLSTPANRLFSNAVYANHYL